MRPCRHRPGGGLALSTKTRSAPGLSNLAELSHTFLISKPLFWTSSHGPCPSVPTARLPDQTTCTPGHSWHAECLGCVRSARLPMLTSWKGTPPSSCCCPAPAPSPPLINLNPCPTVRRTVRCFDLEGGKKGWPKTGKTGKKRDKTGCSASVCGQKNLRCVTCRFVLFLAGSETVLTPAFRHLFYFEDFNKLLSKQLPKWYIESIGW